MCLLPTAMLSQPPLNSSVSQRPRGLLSAAPIYIRDSAFMPPLLPVTEDLLRPLPKQYSKDVCRARTKRIAHKSAITAAAQLDPDVDVVVLFLDVEKG
ncbi:hypothetical protein NDU88_008335 [Pleurodeles waltl]|uniref:Protein-serine/threonine phosphatase n=1 Tax=Pleurodeles waltl TaxID=8319 RepID=A0AAV7QRG7_PLEWA|nr:hypothetical protein NDU88_008335 [Pleurodeles waltl]